MERQDRSGCSAEQDVAVRDAHGALSGTSRGAATAAGTVTGVPSWGGTAAAGASAVLAARETAYRLRKAADAATLVWLGVSALHSSFRAAPESAYGSAAALGLSASLRRSYTGGLPTNLLNPKTGAF